jgi:hypothetical protein
MTYIRLDYALTFFIVYVIVSMVREFYKDYKYKIKPTGFDNGYQTAINDIVKVFNDGITNNLSKYDLCKKN